MSYLSIEPCGETKKTPNGAFFNTYALDLDR